MRSAFLGFLCATLAAQTVDFSREVRPILSDKCFTCHGPDSANRKTKLRFDTEGGAKQDLGGRFAIVPGDPARSHLIQRVTSANNALRMPPAYAGAAPLSEREIGILRRWVEQGAPWQQHWAFVPPNRVETPAGIQPIDHFIAARLSDEGMKMSPEAPRETLIRRVALDLTGVPPTVEEVDAFLNDTADNAYEKVVDRLLASPRYGERMAARWLDAARYADTNGYQTDAERYMWRWRDWVIEAFNRNMPFDRFTVEQLAGDLLPDATRDQIIATGFNRNHRGNGEGGIVPEEYAVEYVADRVETTATVWLGVTLGCARCHDHKYDPFTQKDFYRVFAYFNNVPERGKAFKFGNSPPFIAAPTPEQEEQLAGLETRTSAARRRFEELRGRAEEGQARWTKTWTTAPEWSPRRGLVARHTPAERLDGKQHVNLGDTAAFGFLDKFTLAAWVKAESPDGVIIARAEVDDPEPKGYGLYLTNGKLQLNLVQRWLDDALRVETERALEPGRWYHVAVTYDASRLAAGTAIYIDGERQKLNVIVDELNQDFRLKQPLRIGANLRGEIRGAHVYDSALPPRTVAMLAGRAEDDRLRQCYLEEHAPAEIRSAWVELQELRRERDRLLDSFPTVMVMQERPQARETHLLVRGAYDRPGEKVSPAVPAVLHPLRPGQPNTRLGFARWLVDPANPLTARVMVNRYWQMYFGAGIVKTVEDFGSQGEPPSHPELLDWLATEFIRTGWDIKAMQKTIVMSATYRQSSRATPELLQRDPENRLLARGPRLRLPAETVRDQALAISGLLVEKIGGPSVKPYQPEGLWKVLNGQTYTQDKGEGLYRRSLYTFWKRSAPPPGMMLFDSGSRESCVVRETRTNTPLQALALMNDVTFVEASRVFAARILRAATTVDDRLTWAFRRVTARRPRSEELEVLKAAYHHHLDRYRTNVKSALALLGEGESPRDESLDPAEHAAYTMAASLILNLDAAVTKE
jgi:hypothetical protein